MTDNEIIKALECCNNESESCVDCPLWKFDKCVKRLQKSALDLINRQKAEIERLQSMNQAKLDTIHDLMAEVERLQKEAEKWKNAMMAECMLSNCNREDEIKSEAIKEYIERASIKLTDNARSDYWHWIEDTLHEVEREMVGAD